MSAVEFRSVSRRFGSVVALDRVDAVVEAGSFTVLCGPPRAGKSTLFRLLVGLDAPDAGRILLGGRDVSADPAGRRKIGYVPQSFALFPHFTVRQNIAYPMTLAKAPPAQVAADVERVAGMLSIGHLLAKTPDKLSGGEKQRVAVARGLLKDATVFVLDDPLVGLDYKLRERLMDDLKELCRLLSATFLYATSDSLEALAMAERLILLDGGRVVEQGDPVAVYEQPGHVRALELIGFPQANVVPGRAAGGRVTAGPFGFATDDVSGDTPVVVGLRPEAVRLSEAGALEGRVALVEHLGSEVVVHIEAGGISLNAAFGADRAVPGFNRPVRFDVDPSDIMLFDAASGRRIGRGRA